jgi:hypothetical protein
MPHAPTPWVGLAALAAMFVLPWLPHWLFEGPRTVRHRPRGTSAASATRPGPTTIPAQPRRSWSTRACGSSYTGLHHPPTSNAATALSAS